MFDIVEGWAVQIHNEWHVEVLSGAYAHMTGLKWVIERELICLWREGEEVADEVEGSIIICEL
jgi:hypothetical protein